MLVPTTLLVRQHLETFNERFAGFPVHVRALSRFQTDKEARETVAGLADGTVDMVIGTHRILTEQVRFKDVGLLIIDEEQRFGVEHKDSLKKLKTNVDILAMSATPIPRTLEMAVTGIREMSTLATPPEDRHPILTFVGPVLRAAGRRGDPARDAPRGPGVLRAQPRLVDQPRRGAARRARARGPHRGRARPAQRARARADRGRLLGAQVRRARLDHDHRDRPRHLQRQHDHHRPRRQVRPVAAAPAARARRPRPRARLRLLPLGPAEAALRDRARPPSTRSPRTTSSAAACRSR